MRRVAMPRKKKDDEKKQPTTREIIKKELQEEKRELGKTARLLFLSPTQLVGAIALLTIGLALLLYLLSVSYILAAVLGAVGAMGAAIAVIMNPFKNGKKRGGD